MEKMILILDKEEYKLKEDEIKKVFKDNNIEIQIFYTKYEDNLIRSVRNFKYIGSFLQHIFYWLKSFNYTLKILFSTKQNKIICINPIVGLFLGLLNFRKKREIILCGFLFENKSNKLYLKIRKKISKCMLNNIKYAVVYGSKEVNLYENMFSLKNKFKFVKYGIDYDTNREYKGNLPNEFIFSGGGSNRDYSTLIKAYNLFRKENDTKLCIATKKSCIENENVENITVLNDVVLENFGDVIGKSKFMILSLKDQNISVGHQVLLQALKENKIVLVNKIQAIEDYVDEGQVVFFESKNEVDLKNKMEYIISNYIDVEERYKNNSSYYYNNYTFNELIKRIIKLW